MTTGPLYFNIGDYEVPGPYSISNGTLHLFFGPKYTLELCCKQASSRIIATTAMFAGLKGSHQVSLDVVGVPIHG